MALFVQQIEVGGYDDNFSYLIYDQKTKEAVVIDPSGEVEKIFAAQEELRLKVVAIWLTHTHFDHMDGVPQILEHYGPLPIYVHENGINSVGDHGEIVSVTDYEELTLAEGKVRVMYTPGHIDDAVCFYIAAEAAADGTPKLISGDTLFVGGCGRTSESKVKDLYESLAKLKALPPETEVYPGHDYGPTTTSTIGREITENKYYLAENFNEFKKLRLG